jgi:succinate-acetate transporter protein
MAEAGTVERGAADRRATVDTVDTALQAGAVRPPIADPGAWAVTAFATTSFMLGMYNADLLPAAGVAVVVPVAFFFGGLIQIIVAILEVMRGNVFGAVVFGTYGPFWVIFAALETWYAAKIPAGDAKSALALFLAMFAVVTFYFVIASLRTDAVLVAVFALIFAGLVLLSIGNGLPNVTLTKAGGWVTLAFAVLAWYHAAGDVIAYTFGKKILPMGGLSPASGR